MSTPFIHILFVFFVAVIHMPLTSLYLLVGDVDGNSKRQAYHQVLLEQDYPMCLCINTFPPSQESIDDKLHAIHPQLNSLWVPTALFQLFVVERFFSDDSFRDYVQRLGYSCLFYDDCNSNEVERFCEEKSKGNLWSLYVDEKVISILRNPLTSIHDLRDIYSAINHREDLCTFFIKMNDCFLKSYVEGIEKKWLEEIPNELEEWIKYGFPFLFNASGQESMETLLAVFKDNQQLILKAIHAEKRAYLEGKHLVYRGSDVMALESKNGERLPLLFLPVRCKRLLERFVFEKGMSSFSLSYGNSLFGGVFLSTDACAARYAVSKQGWHYAFHALKLDRKVLLDDPLFCVPPLHPFVEMFTDGEWFHVHTKIIPIEENKMCYGWYAKINRAFDDNLGFIMRRDCSPNELGAKLLLHASEQAEIFHLWPQSISLEIKNHGKAAQCLAEELQ